MGLLDNIGKVSNSISKKAGGLASGLNDLTSAAKGVLCLPAMISGAVSTIPNIIGGIIGGITNTINSSIAAATSIATNAIQGAVDDITSKFNKVNQLLGEIGTISLEVNNFFNAIDNSVADIKSFISDKDNCSFAGAALSKCLAQETLNNLSKRDISSIAKGSLKLEDAINKSVSTGNKLESVVGSNINKHAAQLNRASSILNKANKII